jgi:hypothetical protein
MVITKGVIGLDENKGVLLSEAQQYPFSISDAIHQLI